MSDAPLPPNPEAMATEPEPSANGPGASAGEPEASTTGSETSAGQTGTSANEAGAPVALVKPAKVIDPAAAFAALGNPLRWRILKMLADGRALSASQVAKAVKRDFDGVSKHLRIMRTAGVLSSKRGEDRRLELYHIPDSILRADGVIDLGFCAIRVPTSAG